MTAERDLLKSEVEKLKARLNKCEENARKLAGDLKESKEAEQASQTSLVAMTEQLDKEAEEVKKLKSKLDKDAGELKKLKDRVAKDADELKKLNDKVKALEHIDGTGNYPFIARAWGAEKEYRESLDNFGAEPRPLVRNPSIGEKEFFGCLGAQIKYPPSLLTMCSDYGAVLSTEVAFNLLKGQGCSHYRALSDGRVQVDGNA